MTEAKTILFWSFSYWLLEFICFLLFVFFIV